MTTNGCLNEVPNCDLNTIPIGHSCYPFSETLGADCTSFGVQSQDIDSGTLEVDTGMSSVYDCLHKSAQNPASNGLRWNWDVNECTILGSSGTGSGGAGKGVFSVFKKTKQGTKDCMNIVGPDNLQLSINMGQGKIEPTVSKVTGDYVGSDCRKAITDKMLDPEANAPLLNAMYQWCNQDATHRDIDTCHKLCQMYGETCPGTRDKKSFIFTGILFAVLLVFIILMVRFRKHRKIILIIFLPALIILGVFAGITLFKAATDTNPFPGGNKDYPQGNYPEMKHYPATVMYTCKNTFPNKPQCVPDEKGEWFGLKNCTDNCTIIKCPPGTLPGPDGQTCYQAPPDQEAGCAACTCGVENSCGTRADTTYKVQCCDCHDNCHASCNYGGPKIPEGAYQCIASGSYPNVAWTKCTTSGGCDIANDPCGAPAGESPGACYYLGSPDDDICATPGGIAFCTGPTFNYSTNKYQK